MTRARMLSTALFMLTLAPFATCAASSTAKSEQSPTSGPASPTPSPAVATERSAPIAEPTAPVLTPPRPNPPVAPATAPTAPSEVAAPSGYTGPDPCTLAVKGDSPVAKACREGGIRSAKATMKELVKDARAQGARYQCDDCHSSDTDYAQLGKGAEEKFAKLVATASRK